MPMIYKIDVLAELKKAGYSSYRIRRERIFGEATLTQIRRGELASWAVIERLCELLGCTVGDIVEYRREGDV